MDGFVNLLIGRHQALQQRPSRLPNHQFRRQCHLQAFYLNAIDHPADIIGRQPAHFKQRLTNSCEWRVADARLRDIVEANHRDIFGHTHATPTQCAYRAERHLIIAGKNRGWRIIE
jgi:hypothetical protein